MALRILPTVSLLLGALILVLAAGIGAARYSHAKQFDAGLRSAATYCAAFLRKNAAEFPGEDFSGLVSCVYLGEDYDKLARFQPSPGSDVIFSCFLWQIREQEFASPPCAAYVPKSSGNHCNWFDRRRAGVYCPAFEIQGLRRIGYGPMMETVR